MTVLARDKKTRPEIFKEVDETIYFKMEFPCGTTAKAVSSYNKNLSHLQVKAEHGWFRLTQVNRYTGMESTTSIGAIDFNPNANQQALQIDDFTQCILQYKPTRVFGEEGLKVLRVIEAIYRSIASGKRETI